VHWTPRTFFWLLQRSLVATFDDGCLGTAKGAAYSALLSFFPVLTSAAAILLQSHAGFVSSSMERMLAEIVPPESEGLVFERFRAAGAHPLSLLVIAGIVSVWAASGVIKSLIEGFHAAYRVPRGRHFLRQQWVAMGLVLMAAVPLVCASFLVFFGAQIERLVLNSLRVDPLLNPLSGLWTWVSRIARYVLAFAAAVAATGSLYYYGPYRRQRWRFVWPGAALATVLWWAATSGFAWYTRHIAHYNLTYGSIAAAIVLLVWMYVLALIALIGCEFNAVCERSAR
jgi:membrane protein